MGAVACSGEPEWSACVAEPAGVDIEGRLEQD